MINFKISYRGDFESIQDAVSAVNKALVNPAFLLTIDKVVEFDFSSDGHRPLTGSQVSNLLAGTNIVATVQTYKGWFWSKALAYVNPGTKVININSRKIFRDYDKKKNIASLAGTILHEYTHVIDSFHPFEMGHGDNYASGKENSVPYLVGELLQEFLLKQ